MMPIIYVYRCGCGKKIEDLNPGPPLCSLCSKLMPRVMKIYRGCARPSNRLVSPREVHEREYYREQDAKINQNTKRIKNNKAVRRRSLRNYAAADMHNRHGHGVEELDRSARKIEEMR